MIEKASDKPLACVLCQTSIKRKDGPGQDPKYCAECLKLPRRVRREQARVRAYLEATR